jgi:hypothetical protein
MDTAPAGELAVSVAPDEALIESSFRRLLAAIDSEKARVRAEALRVETERQETIKEQNANRGATQDWCKARMDEIRAAWEKLDETADVMKQLILQGDDELIDIRCGTDKYTLPRSLLEFEDSYLGALFRGEDMGITLPTDEENYLVLDVDPDCWKILVQFLQTRRLAPNCPTPPIPPEKWRNMEELLDALNIKAFSKPNRINRFTRTSLKVTADRVESTYDGWQVITSEDPVSSSKTCYFEVTVEKNQIAKGGLAIGIIDHVPIDDEVNSLFNENAVLYNSGNGLNGAAYENDTVMPNVLFAQGSTVGVHYSPVTHAVTWYVKQPFGPDAGTRNIGSCKLIPNLAETIYPAFALYSKRTVVRVEFPPQVPADIQNDTKRDVFTPDTGGPFTGRTAGSTATTFMDPAGVSGGFGGGIGEMV